jgi:hypothetical protein
MLLTCPDCGGPVSELAAACPKCGRPTGAVASAPPAVPAIPQAAPAPAFPTPKQGVSAARGLATLLVLLTLIGGGIYLVSKSDLGKSSNHQITGTFTLMDTSSSPSVAVVGSDCWGTVGYSDIEEGATVTLRDEHGTVLASGALSLGHGDATGCSFTFTLDDVPDSATFYAVTVSHRGEISKSHADMVSDGWTFSLTLGS